MTILTENEIYYYQSDGNSLKKHQITCYDIISNNISSHIFNGEEKYKILINDLVVNNTNNMFFNVILNGNAYEIEPVCFFDVLNNENSNSLIIYNIEKLIDGSYKFKKLWIYIRKSNN